MKRMSTPTSPGAQAWANVRRGKPATSAVPCRQEWKVLSTSRRSQCDAWPPRLCVRWEGRSQLEGRRAPPTACSSRGNAAAPGTQSVRSWRAKPRCLRSVCLHQNRRNHRTRTRPSLRQQVPSVAARTASTPWKAAWRYRQAARIRRQQSSVIRSTRRRRTPSVQAAPDALNGTAWNATAAYSSKTVA